MTDISFTIFGLEKNRELGGIATIDGKEFAVRHSRNRLLGVCYMGIWLYAMETDRIIYSMIDVYKANIGGWRIGDPLPPASFSTLPNGIVVCGIPFKSDPIKLRGIRPREMKRIGTDFYKRLNNAMPGCPKYELK
jgi:hypothetical protein